MSAVVVVVVIVPGNVQLTNELVSAGSFHTQYEAHLSGLILAWSLC